MKKEDFIYASSVLCTKWINKFKEPENLSFHKILVIKLDEIGDMVNSVHVFSLLKNEYPNAEITLWCKPFLIPLLSSDAHISRFITNKSELENKYDLIVDLRGTFESNWFALTHPPKYRLDRGTIRLRNKFNGGQLHEVITNLQIIEPVIKKLPSNLELKLYHSKEDEEVVHQFLKNKNIKKFAVLHCEARRELRKWKPEKFAEIAKYLHRKYKFDILFAGEESDSKAIDNIRNMLDFETYNLAGEFTLSGFATLVSKASIFIGNESGPLHIAAASQCKSIGLFGPGVKDTFYPWGLHTAYIHHVLECNPCDQIHCVHPEYTCMDRILESEVKAKIDILLT